MPLRARLLHPPDDNACRKHPKKPGDDVIDQFDKLIRFVHLQHDSDRQRDQRINGDEREKRDRSNEFAGAQGHIYELQRPASGRNRAR